MPETSRIISTLEQYEADLLKIWSDELVQSDTYREELLSRHELDDQCRQFLILLRSSLREGAGQDIEGEGWSGLRAHLADVLNHWVDWGMKPAEVAAFVLLLKRPLFSLQAEKLQLSENDLVSTMWTISTVLDRLALWTTEAFQHKQQAVIHRQQEELLELSTPVVELWHGILALPLIGTLDSARTQTVMESLLEKIVETGADVAILDITGVPTVDTMVAQHLLKAVTAARLMGANCIISGIRPTIAQTMVQLGVDLREVTTKATLADAFAVAMQRQGLSMHTTHARAAE